MFEILKTRTMLLVGPPVPASVKMIPELLSCVDGVRSVKIMAPDQVRIEYDLMMVCRQEIEQKLSSLGFQFPNGILERWKRSWIDAMERNEYDNMTTPPRSCCSNLERIVGPRHRRR